ncbi:LacI family transcriptional regulator [Fischerella thermalis CCMEE 5330]|uniref:LacI family transcriptional regulator n=1 Tax=Fischerella thermalis CCMEE 5330 TaxID=2019670 RepID=A0A2N6MNN8_9CYAN|nr:LacI family transcriptional regulator [Fischerella thermalis CCMEE 5330]
MSRVTIKDVARHAGVGLGTVSRVMNNHPRVSPETRERVLKAIRELGFRPNATARRLPRKAELHYIGVITHPFLLNYHSISERLRGIQTALNNSSQALELALFSASSAAHFDSQLQNITQANAVEGLLIIDFDLTDEQAQRLQQAHIPFVGLNHLRGRSWPCIGTDNEYGGYIATRYLTELGHRRIAYIGDNMVDEYGFSTSQERYVGYKRALAEAQIHLNSRYVRLGDHSYQMAYDITESLLRLAQPPTAIFAMSDLQAAGIIAALRAAGVNVPGEVSVIGYDDTELAMAMGLTTICQHLEQSGRLAATYLMELIAGGNAPPPVLPSAHLVVRQTTRPPMHRLS